MLILATLLWPLIAGLISYKIWRREPFIKIALLVQCALAGAAIYWGGEITLVEITPRVAICLRADGVSKFFLGVVTFMFTVVGFYSFDYMKREGGENRFYLFYLITLFALTGVSLSSGLIGFYAFYELMTLASVPLVMHSGTKEAVSAGIKYLIYSIAGAMLGLFGIFVINANAQTLIFQAGGALRAGADTGLVLTAAFLMIIGFGAKAGMFPLHAWLPTAHPVAPSPASAVLSGVITKAGVLGILRSVYYVVGADTLRGTWVQYAFMTLALVTVFMGSMLAYREEGLKKRLAYSTVSQVSYILFGIATLNEIAFKGAMMHVAFHSMMKCALFMCAGAFIMKTGRTRVSEMRGIGKTMPVTLGAFAVASLGLVGIPPTCGFLSKWNIAAGALNAGLGNFSWAGPAVLIISAILTAGYLFPVVINGYFPGDDISAPRDEAPVMMRACVILLSCLIVLAGVFQFA